MFKATFKLSLMKKTQARRQEGDDGCGAMDVVGKSGGGARFVVIFKESGELVLVVRRGHEMFAHWPGVACPQTVIETFVVGVIESLLL